MDKNNLTKIQFYPPIDLSQLRTGLNTFITNPPKGYTFIASKSSPKNRLFNYLKRFNIANTIYRILIDKFKLIHLSEVIHSTDIANEAQLVFSRGLLYNQNNPWVLYLLDSPYSIAGNNYNNFAKNKHKIQDILEKDNCKKIIYAHKSIIDFIKSEFSEKVSDKTELIRPAVEQTSFKMPKNKFKKNKPMQLLFMGSINNPEDFYIKGGLESIEVIENLQNKYKNIKLIIRCKLPEELRQRVKNNPNIELIEEKVAFEDLIKLYTNSDILLFPSHIYVLMVTLEAMNFGLPIVCLDTYAVRDYIVHGKTGLIVKKSDKINGYAAKEYPLNIREKSFIGGKKFIDKEVINRLSNAVEQLINNPVLRKRMSENAIKLAKNKFSIVERNKQLKKVFDNAVMDNSLD